MEFEALEEELAQREKDREEKQRQPIDRSKVDWTDVYETVVYGVTKLIDEGCEPKDHEHYIYEAAMEAVYGKDVWSWYNKLV